MAAIPRAQPDFVSEKYCPPGLAAIIVLPSKIASLNFIMRLHFADFTSRGRVAIYWLRAASQLEELDDNLDRQLQGNSTFNLGIKKWHQAETFSPTALATYGRT